MRGRIDAFVVALLVVAAAAGAIRAVNVTVWRPSCTEDLVATARAGDREPPTEPGCFAVVNDALYGHLQGRLLADGHGYVDGVTWFYTRLATGDDRYVESAGDPPLYAAFLAGVTVLGVETTTGHRLVSGLVGTIGVVLIGLAGRRLAGRRAGLVAAALAAVYPMLWINDGMLLSESLYAPLCAVVVLAAYRWWDRTTLPSAAGFGAAIGLAALTRAEAALLVGVAVLPLAWGIRRRRSTRVAVGGAATAMAVGALTLVPWVGWNLTRFEEPVTMTSGTGAVLSAGLCDATLHGPLMGYYANCFDQYVADGIVDGWPDPDRLDESQRDKVSREGALAYLEDHLDRMPVVVVVRVARMWDLYAPGQNTELNWQIEGRDKWASEAAVRMYLVLLPLAVAGVVVLWRRQIPVSPLVALAVVVTVTAALTFGVTRYRVPADVAVVLAAAVAVDAALGRRWPSAGGTITPRGADPNRSGPDGPEPPPLLPPHLLAPTEASGAR